MYSEGQITPPSGSLTIQHGIQSKNFTISVSWCSHDRFHNFRKRKKNQLEYQIYLRYSCNIFQFILFQYLKKTQKTWFPLQVVAILNRTELFALYLAKAPSTTARGGARLSSANSVIRLEPHGVIRFAPNSTHPQSVSEMESSVRKCLQHYMYP